MQRRNLISKRKYNSIFHPLLVVLFFGIHLQGWSQPGLDTLAWQERFTMFLQEDETDEFLTDEIYPGSFSFKPSQNPAADYKEMDPGLFREPSSKLAEYYSFLENLNPEEKQKLIRTFSFFKDDFQSILEKEGLPAELKYLPSTLSAMNFLAVGDMHRAGIWQLTHLQAVLNGAQINKLVDERFHPLKSTPFAVNQLKHDFEIYNDYNLAVAALICGNTVVKNAMAQAGENGGWNEISDYLPEYFQQTLAAFQAMTVFLNTNKFIRNEGIFFEKPDTIFLDKQIHFEQLAEISGLTITDLKFLNPQFKHSIIPAGVNTFEVALPARTKNEFLAMQDSIFEIEDSTLFQLAEQRIEYPPEPTRSFIGQAAKDIEIDGKTRIEYMLQTGDVLGIIAEKFDVSVSDLKYWNNIYNERRIQAGQKISVFVPDEKAAFYVEMAAPTGGKEKTGVDYSKIPADRKKVEHVVQNGESPFVIAKKYDGVTPEAILQWNHIDNARKIQIGQKLILYIPK